MSSALPPEAAGLLALGALVLLPGLLVVRAPWTAVPALSVAFWALSWWWLPLAGRSRVLQASLVVFAVLALLRLLPRHTVPPPPGHAGPAPPPLVTGPMTGDVPRLRSVPSVLVVAVALALIAPWPLWPHAPGREMAFHTTSSRLALWRDGLPATYQPLFPFAPFGAHAPALPTLATDVSLLSDLDPGRAVVVVAFLSAGLLFVALFALLGTRLRPASAALAALLGLAAVPWPGFLAIWGEWGAVLALALGLSAAALLVGHSSRPSAVAAGMLLGAAVLAQPLLALTVAAVLVARLGNMVRWTARRGRGDASLREGRSPPRFAGPARASGRRDRVWIALGVAAVLGAPALVRLVQALSVTEAIGLLGSLRGAEVVQLLTSGALLALAALLAHYLGRHRDRSGALAAVLLGVSAAILLVSVHAAPAPGQLAPGTLRSLARLEAAVRPRQAVCAPDKLADWVPALAGRPAGGSRSDRARPWVPPVFRDESRRFPPPPCAARLDLPGLAR